MFAKNKRTGFVSDECPALFFKRIFADFYADRIIKARL